MISGLLKGWLWKLAAGALAVLGFLLWLANMKNDKLQAQKARAQQKAKGEKAAREHVEGVVEKTNEVEDDIRKSDPDSRRDELREYARGPSTDDSD